MPKSLCLGNGNILITFDSRAHVRDFYFPFVGLENQAGSFFIHRIGVFIDGRISWLSDPEWEIYTNYQEDSLVSDIQATNTVLRVKLEFNDTVYNEKNIFIRKVIVNNLADTKRTIKIFFHQEFEMYESHRGDTSYYDPVRKFIIHYKGRRIFLINAVSGDSSFDDYSVGLFRIEGKEGTWKDAEDGMLSKNAIEHGLVDSVIGLTLEIDAYRLIEVYYWISAGKTIREVNDMNYYVLEKTPNYLIRTTRDYWHAWVNRQPFKFHDLDDSAVRLFKKSLLIMRTHVDNRGAILASGDTDTLHLGRDTYSYMWPRDGALIAMALDETGDASVAKKFFEFCNEIVEDEGFFMHRYRADQSLGSSWHPWIRDGKPELPIQEDETAIIIYALWKHYKRTKDLEFIESIYNSLIKKCAEFLVFHRDESTGLPKPSYDLWEEKFGISTFTSSCVYAALLASAKFASLLGKTDAEVKYTTAAKDIQKAILKYLYDENGGFFYKMINLKKNKTEIDKTIDISSIYAIVKFKVLSVFDERVKKAIVKTQEKLTVPGIGGIARYEGDKYFTADENLPGNPWIITTLWLAQYYLMAAKGEDDLKPVKKILSYIVKYAQTSGILPEQLHPYTGEHISATPLIWSHAEYVTTVVKYLNKLKELDICKDCNPLS